MPLTKKNAKITIMEPSKTHQRRLYLEVDSVNNHLFKAQVKGGGGVGFGLGTYIENLTCCFLASNSFIVRFKEFSVQM